MPLLTFVCRPYSDFFERRKRWIPKDKPWLNTKHHFVMWRDRILTSNTIEWNHFYSFRLHTYSTFSSLTYLYKNFPNIFILPLFLSAPSILLYHFSIFKTIISKRNCVTLSFFTFSGPFFSCRFSVSTLRSDILHYIRARLSLLRCGLNDQRPTFHTFFRGQWSRFVFSTNPIFHCSSYAHSGISSSYNHYSITALNKNDTSSAV